VGLTFLAWGTTAALVYLFWLGLQQPWART
jgi:hypothetical protein